MGINLSDNVHVSAPKPVESKYLNITVPYTGTSQVNTCIASGERYLGLTVNISNVEYWYHNGVLDSCLVSKSAGGTWGSITGILSGQTDLQTCLNGKLASGGTAICATTAGNALCLGGVLPAGYLLSGGTAKNSLCLGGNLANTYAPLASPNFTTCICTPVMCSTGVVKGTVISGSTCVESPVIQLTTGAAAGCVFTSNATGCGVWCTPAASGLVWSGSTANGVGTYYSATKICSNANMTFDGTKLGVTGNICASTCLCSPIVLGTTCVCGAITCGSTCVASAVLYGSTCSNSPLHCGACGIFTTCTTSPIFVGGGLAATCSAIQFQGKIDTSVNYANYLLFKNEGNTINFSIANGGLGNAFFPILNGKVTSTNPALYLVGNSVSGITAGTGVIGFDGRINNTCVSAGTVLINFASGYGNSKARIMGDGTFCAPIICATTCFVGSGVGLTGTAASLTAGVATTANALCGCVPSCFLGAGATAVCATTAGNALCLGGALANTYAPLTSPSIVNNMCITNASNPWIMLCKTNATARTWYVQAYGDLVSIGGLCVDVSCNTYATDFIASSDCRLKKCIKPIMGALSTIMKLEGVCYELCDDEKHENNIGLIAQSVQKVLPEIVSHSTPNENDGKYGITDDKLGLKYDKFSAIIIEAMKEQQKQIEENKKQISALCLELNYMRNYNK